MPAKKNRKRDDYKRNRPKDESTKESDQSGENELIFTLEILRVVEEAQRIHGLRHSDYLRYRTYCSNKIHRLRRLLKLTQNERRHYRKKVVDVKHLAKKGSDPKLLQIPLFLSERAWATAMEMRPSCDENSRKKFHLVRRLRKAVAYAKQLDGLCQSKYCDAQTKLESQAYLEWIRGVLNFELQNWETAAASFKVARIIYENLASTITDLGNRIYKKKADEINHNLRFCHYNLGTDDQFNILQFRKEGTGILNNLEVLLKQTKMRRKDELRDIEWYGLKMAVRPEKVRTFLFAVQALDQSLDTIDSNSEKIKLFDQILMDCRDAITLTIEDAKLNKHDNSNLEKYLKAIRLRRTIERNTLMMEQGEKEKTVMRLYDIILEQLTELESLLPPDSIDYRDELKKIAYFQPVKFYSLAKIMAKQSDLKKNRDDCLKVLDLLQQAEFECNQLPLDIDTDLKLNKIFSAIQEHKSIVSGFLEDDDVMLDCSTLNLNGDDDSDDDFVDAVDDSFV